VARFDDRCWSLGDVRSLAAPALGVLAKTMRYIKTREDRALASKVAQDLLDRLGLTADKAAARGQQTTVINTTGPVDAFSINTDAMTDGQLEATDRFLDLLQQALAVGKPSAAFGAD
jgi:hypothetical protein